MCSPTYQSDFFITSHNVVYPAGAFISLHFKILHFFVNFAVIPVHFYYLVFCFKLYILIVDIIVNHIFSVRVKALQNTVTRTKKPTVIYWFYPLSV